MEKLAHVRIDDRLIHGQIVVSWIDYLGCNEIVIADNKAVKDEFSKSLLQMACPPAVDLHILSVDDAAEYLINSQNRAKTLVIVRDIDNAHALLDHEGVGIDEINVGNVSSGKGRTKYSKSVWLNEDEVAKFKDLASKGVHLEVRVVPSEGATDLLTMIK